MKERILRHCLNVYPQVVRERDGRAILDLAVELSSKSHWAFAREVAGMLAGGVGARAKLVWSDLVEAPWRAALDRLALPLAVATLCLALGYVSGAYRGLSHWMGWWALLLLVGGAVAVWGTAAARRVPTVLGATLLLGLMMWDAFGSVDSGYSRWWGNVYIGQLNVLAMWLPVALLLFICSWAVGRSSLRRSRVAKWWMIGPPAAAAALSGPLVWSLIPDSWAYPNPLGGVFVWLPFALVLGTVIRGVACRDAILRTVAGILVLASVLPFMWVFAMFLEDPPGPDQYILLTYWAPGIVVALAILLMLLRRKETRALSTPIAWRRCPPPQA